MRRLHSFAATVLLLPLARADTPAQTSGFVTAVQPSGEFDIQGFHIRLTPSTEFRIRTAPGSTATVVRRPASFYPGEAIDEATGNLDRAAHTITATRIVLVSPTTASIHGTAIIDLIPPAPPAQPANERLVRADGYLLHITENTKLKFSDPLKSLSDIATNQWIDYSGVQQLDGTVSLSAASIGPNLVNQTEDKLRTRSEYDPAAVPDSSHQSGVSKVFRGVDPKQIPPYHDDAMQARVQRIGNSLIPAYQRALPNADPTKLHFRFQVIDATKWRDAWTMSSGVIVVPRQVVERMQNDSQLATVLADNIAEALEKDAVRNVPVGHRLLAAEIAGDAAGVFLPGAGLATGLTGGGIAAHVQAMRLQQSGRVSLDFLHDAGYDIDQAPMAWWLLGPKSPKPIEKISMPPRATTLYVMLGTTWHPIADAPAPH